MASSRRTASNEQISTFGDGKTYTDFQTWETAKQGDKVTQAQSDILEGYDKSPHGHYDTDIVFQNSTCSGTLSTGTPTYTLGIRAATGEGHTGKWDTGVGVDSTSNSHVIKINDDWIFIQDLEITQHINTVQNKWAIYTANQGTAIVGCLIMDMENIGTGRCYGGEADGVIRTFWVNNGFKDVSDVDWQAVWRIQNGSNTAGDGPIFYNNTIYAYDGSSGVRSVYGSADWAILKNVYVASDASDEQYSYGSYFDSNSVTCGGNQAEGTGSHKLAGTGHSYNLSPSFVDAANNDFHLQSTDTALKDAGTDLSADSYFAFDDDVDGDIRSGTWDRGFDEVPGVLQTIDPTGIASLETFGTPQYNFQFIPSGIASVEGFGTPTIIPGGISFFPSGIVSSEAFGTFVAQVYLQSITGIGSQEVFGTPQYNFQFIPSGIASQETFGTALIQLYLQAISGIGSQEAFGNHIIVPGPVTVISTGIASDEVFGSHVFQITGFLFPTGIVSDEVFGSSTIQPGAISFSPTGISSQEAFGILNLIIFIVGSGIGSLEAFGSPQIQYDQFVVPGGINSLEGFGVPIVSYASQAFQPFGIASSETVPTITVHAFSILDINSIPSEETFGSSTILPGEVFVQPFAIGSQEQVGIPTTKIYIANITGIPTEEVFSNPVMELGPAFIKPLGVGGAEQFGLAVVFIPSQVLPTQVFIARGKSVFTAKKLHAFTFHASQNFQHIFTVRKK